MIKPLERLADLVLYLPLGLALRAREELPKLAAQGRQRVADRAPLAHMVGQMAVAQGRRKVGGMIDRRSEPPAPAERGVAVPVRDLTDDAAPAPPAPAAAEAAPAAADLPIPGYDSLSASQVVQLLPGLSSDELDAVRAYELAGPNRKTVLLRVAQLRAG